MHFQIIDKKNYKLRLFIEKVMDINKALATFSKNSFKCRVFSKSQYQGQGISNLSNINQVGQVVLQKGHEQSITRTVSTASIFL